ncbi:membrane protein [Ligilactobacillus salitolerans]|uniref:Membrane protein n=1 Tax=Ligilactobacillus salitolerans TaxID=1808352 RepID=A0A401IS14_9LACO|nr:DUF6198 family protein [Ligilactobacillus salitolerans]GBG94307.1 membrane protein [Ligilactobacillus salitolerans]
MQNQLRQALRLKNLVILALALIFMAAGVSLAKIASLGTSPIASIPNVLSFIFPLSLGTWTIIFMFVCVGFEALFLRNHFSFTNILQVLPGLFFGLFINLFVKVFSFIHPDFYWQKLLLTLISVLVLGFGVFLEISSNSIIMPGEGLARAVSIGVKIPFPTAKIWVDSSMVVAALILALAVFHSLTGIREGTIIAALLVGQVVAGIKKLVDKK